MTWKDIELELTCQACPEQYDAFLNGIKVGYLRLRHGYFRAEYPDCNGLKVYESSPIGDGIFESHERQKHLKKAKKAIWKAYKKDKKL